jgi:DNA polymerase/3'-5' exonuclease PolX
MTTELTDAVRRLKELQSDVERLKAARDQEGVPRLFFETDEEAVAVDDLVVKGPDLSSLERATATDAQTDLRLQRTVEDTAAYNSTGYNTTSYN